MKLILVKIHNLFFNMEQRNEFNISLFSNDSMEVHPENKISSWTTELDSAIELGYYLIIH